MSDTSRDTITGHAIHLDATRLVFLGESPDHPNAKFLGFRNENGEDTKIMLSGEAMAALIKLATESPEGARTTFPHKMVWRVVRRGTRA